MGFQGAYKKLNNSGNASIFAKTDTLSAQFCAGEQEGRLKMGAFEGEIIHAWVCLQPRAKG